MCATFIDRLYMVNLVNRNIPTILKALLAQGMLRHVKLSTFTPIPTIMFVMIAAMLFVIFTIGYGFVFVTITTYFDSSRATVVSTGFLG